MFLRSERSYVDRNVGGWGDPAVPKDGWQCVGITDLGKPLKICEMCDVMAIRYVHHMKHENYDEQLDCGCVCAGYMENDIDAARRREGFLKGKLATWKRKLGRYTEVSGWDALGSQQFFQRFGQRRVLITPFKDGFRAVVYSNDAPTIFGKIVHATPQDAIRAVVPYIFPKPTRISGDESHG